MMRPLVCLGLGLAMGHHAQTQALRDPMQMPFHAPSNLPTRAPGAMEAHDNPESRSADLMPRWEGPVSVMRIEGQPRLVVGTRLMGVGQTLGPERIERITETEVWLSQGSQQRRLALFEGIKRSASPAPNSHHTPGAPQ